MAQHNLGLCYAQGRGVEQDYVQAAFWARRAAEQGVVQAVALLGTLTFFGDGVPQDKESGLNMLLQAADLGDEWARRAIEQIMPNAD